MRVPNSDPLCKNRFIMYHFLCSGLLMNKLPISVIQNVIEPFTRSPKSKELCNDIDNFVRTLKKLHTFYCYKILGDVSEGLSHLYCENLLIITRLSWSFIEIDIIGYLYHHDYMYLRWRRMGGMASLSSYDVDVDNIKKYKEKMSFVRRVWGILTPLERFEFKLYILSLPNL